MKVAGIIAEYNPFHNGHAYQIRELQKRTGADYIIIAMSGNFVQRGGPAIMDKYIRTQMALENGADLVLEIPTIWATASAEFFARGGVSLLESTGISDYLGFGAEADHLPLLRKISAILAEEPPEYKKTLSENLKTGMSFPAARASALSGYLSDAANSGRKPDCHKNSCTGQLFNSTNILMQPNNILALEYLKALKTMEPILIPRIGDGYHAKSASSSYASATAIRRILLSVTANYGTDTLHQKREYLKTRLYPLLPSSCLEKIMEYLNDSFLLSENDFSQMLGCRLLSLSTNGYEEYADCSPDLSIRIQKSLYDYRNFSQFCQLLKTKELTYSRISRTLLHILLDIKKEDLFEINASGCGFGGEIPKTLPNMGTLPPRPVPYLRVLGFRKEAAPLLHAIKSNSSLPLITKMADAASLLPPEKFSILEKDLRASELYMQVVRSRTNRPSKNEMNRGLILLP